MNKPDRTHYTIALAAAAISLIGGIGIGLLIDSGRAGAPIAGLLIGAAAIAISVLLWHFGQQAARHDPAAALETRLAEAEQTRKRLQEELAAQQSIAAQLGAQIEALSAPVIPIRQGIVVVPLIGALDIAQLERMGQSLLHGIEQQSARVAIIDLTGVTGLAPNAVPQLARVISSVKLMGCQTLLTGLNTDTVRALLAQKLDLHAQARLNLEAGIAYASNLVLGQTELDR